MEYDYSLAYAQELDSNDELRFFREKFLFPQVNGSPALYFCGNSLGLQPKTTRDYIDRILNDWSEHAVEGHFKIDDPWLTYHEKLKQAMAAIVGAQIDEVTVMNSLTVNLHLMMVSFYRPTKERFKIICEEGAFPSDQYAFETQVLSHGLSPDTCIIELKPREGEYTLRTEDILDTIARHGKETALVLLGGLNYYTGQVYDMKSITEAGHKAGAFVGFDLAHAVGNINLQLHDWNADFAVWCTYKYLNSGPGGVAGMFVNRRFAERYDIPRFAGWFGNDVKTRFKMQKGFKPAYGADGWKLSNSPILLMAALRSSLAIFEEAGMERIGRKRNLLTSYLEYIIHTINKHCGRDEITIITPSAPEQRGSQLSLLLNTHGKSLFNYLIEEGIIVDWREPNVIRVSPVPLYNSFEDVLILGQKLETFLKKHRDA